MKVRIQDLIAGKTVFTAEGHHPEIVDRVRTHWAANHVPFQHDWALQFYDHCWGGWRLMAPYDQARWLKVPT